MNVTTEVATRLGTLRGRARDGIEQYLGVRYAAPPVGDRRFRPPAPVEPWEGMLDATRAGASSPLKNRSCFETLLSELLSTNGFSMLHNDIRSH